ncbi:AAA family ATPase [Microbacterium sp. SYP-A9085]|uniref:MobF family relaxase n=1 Tax=Microbacterium sp. SYP-A9085 TaxID=2664454 RepID=UPI00129BC541|nr:MobF family relaxase [Microbacterium sp. SYP-A9085]MRH29599.1 AAA family ATPase [Microbacterium sp. SYP-A9085]
MKGGVIPFRGTGSDALRYLESDRARADEYYLEAGTALAEFTAVDAEGRVIGELGLTSDEYRQWVDWINPITGESMGRPRLPGEGRRGSPRFMEMVVNVPKSLSVAAGLHPEVSEALDAAQRDAVAEIRSWLGQHSLTRIGPRGKQDVMPIEQLETVAVSHKTSRAGDPHRHIHFQIGTRVWAGGAWRGLYTAALFRQQGAIRALGTAVIAAHPQLAAVLDAHGLTLDPVTGEVAELVPWNAVMSKRGAQVARNLARFEAEWEAAHPGETPGPVVRARLHAKAWDHERPSKKPSVLGSEAGWLRELQDAGYTPDLPRATVQPVRTLDELAVQQVASRALDRCAAAASAWSVHDVQEQVARIVTEAGVRATRGELRDFITITTQLAADDCLSILPPDAPRPEHVAHLTTLHVVAVETELRDRLAARATRPAHGAIPRVQEAGLDADQARAAAAVASTRPLVVVEGAAGAGKTTMLGAAIRAAGQESRSVRVVTPTKKAADVAAVELGVPTDSVAALVYDHGFRWNADGVWTRLAAADTDPLTGATYRGPAKENRLAADERVVVDEAGMLDQDTALALLTVADEAGATLALVGDRAQLPAVGRGGVLDIAADLVPRVYSLTSLHRFADPDYAQLTLDLRTGRNPAELFDRLHALGLVLLHEDAEALRAAVAAERIDGAAITAATNDEARELNALIREDRVRAGVVDDARSIDGADGLSIGAGDLIQTRRNDSEVGVANRQIWIVQQVGDDGSLWVRDAASERKQQRTVHLPAEYVAEHAHLAYAATAYGVQGMTAPASHTVLSDALDAAGVYVGLTRGQEKNRLHVVAADLGDAREQFTAALERDRADRGLREATGRAQAAVAGIVADGPVRVVNAERARLRQGIEQAERQAAWWAEAAEAIARQSAAHRVEAETRRAEVEAAAQQVEEARAEVIPPLIEQAGTDAAAVLAVRKRHEAAIAARSWSGALRRRSADRALAEAERQRHDAENLARQRWGSIPRTPEQVPAWAQMAAEQQAEADPRLADAMQTHAQVRQEQRRAGDRQEPQRGLLHTRLFGIPYRTNIPRRRADDAQRQAEALRRQLAELEALPVAEAAAQIEARAEAERIAAEALTRRAEGLHDFTRDPSRQLPGIERDSIGL